MDVEWWSLETQDLQGIRITPAHARVDIPGSVERYSVSLVSYSPYRATYYERRFLAIDGPSRIADFIDETLRATAGGPSVYGGRLPCLVDFDLKLSMMCIDWGVETVTLEIAIDALPQDPRWMSDVNVLVVDRGELGRAADQARSIGNLADARRVESDLVLGSRPELDTPKASARD